MHVEGRFPPVAQSVRAARDLVRVALDAVDIEVDREHVVLATSELATNAAIHAAAEPFEVVVDIDSSGVCLAVRDASSEPPIRRELDVTTVGGRGVAVVEALSSSWGVERCGQGKRVWCRFAA